VSRAPRILALDTATEACSAALTTGDEICERYAELDRGHGERILPMIDELLREAGWSLNDLDAIAFGRGPGAFTGVRLAASIAQGLAFGAGLRVVPVSNLAALAQRGFVLHPRARQAWVAADARMRECYCGAFERADDGGARALGPERVLPADAVAVSLADLSAPAQVTIAIGRGLRVYPEVVAQTQAFAAEQEPDELPRAADVAALALIDWAAGRSVAPEQAIPVYLRDNVAQVPVTPLQ
jgi:tRNA threonylcarbamoyladenosine biosynthesis protein TsaB